MAETRLEKKIKELIEMGCLYAEKGDREHYRECMEKGTPYHMATLSAKYKHSIDEDKLAMCLNKKESAICFRSEYRIEKQKGDIRSLDEICPNGVTLEEQFRWIFSEATAVINNVKWKAGSMAKSYSKSVVIPLFKYGNADSRLIVKRLNVNTMKLKVRLKRPDIVDVWDKLYVNISFHDVNNVDRIKEYIREELRQNSDKKYLTIEEYVDIDIDIIGYTLDVSALSKQNLCDLAYTSEQVGFRKSFRKDQEIVSSELVDPKEIQSEAATQFARFLVLFCLYDDMKAVDKLRAAYDAKDMTKEFEYDAYEKWGFEQIYTHMTQQADQVRKDWIEVELCGRKDYFVGNSLHTKAGRQTVVELIERLRIDDRQLLSNDQLYNRVMEIIEQ